MGQCHLRDSEALGISPSLVHHDSGAWRDLPRDFGIGLGASGKLFTDARHHAAKARDSVTLALGMTNLATDAAWYDSTRRHSIDPHRSTAEAATTEYRVLAARPRRPIELASANKCTAM
eukprot:3085804-Pleurochrysis_carterae.AAC.1